MSINGHKNSCIRIMYLKRKKRKDTYYSHYIPQNISTLPLTKWSYTNSPPKNDYSHIKIRSPPFCHEWQRVTVLSRHLIGRASISIIWSIIVIILILRSRSHGRRWWWSSLRSKTTHRRLSSCNMTDTNIHLIQLCRECIEASIHALQLRHDILKTHPPKKKEEPIWMELNGMELDERKELLNPTATTEVGPLYV